MATMNSHLLHARLGPALLVLACLLFIPGPTPGAQARTGVDDMIATDNRTVLITGANRGLGLEFARQYAKAGWGFYPGFADTSEKAWSAPGCVSLDRHSC